MSVQVAIAKAIVGRLRADTALGALLPDFRGIEPIFTRVPEKLNQYPYIVLYEAELNEDDNSETDCYDGTLTLHTWSDDRDLSEVGNIQKAIKNALHRQDFNFDGYGLIEIHQEFQTILRDPDGILLHGVQRYRILLNEG